MPSGGCGPLSSVRPPSCPSWGPAGLAARVAVQGRSQGGRSGGLDARTRPRRVWGSREGRRGERRGPLAGGALTEEQQHVPGARPVHAAEPQHQQKPPAGRPPTAHGGGGSGSAAPPGHVGQAPPTRSRVPGPRPSLPLPLRCLRTRLRRRRRPGAAAPGEFVAGGERGLGGVGEPRGTGWGRWGRLGAGGGGLLSRGPFPTASPARSPPPSALLNGQQARGAHPKTQGPGQAPSRAGGGARPGPGVRGGPGPALRAAG